MSLSEEKEIKAAVDAFTAAIAAFGKKEHSKAAQLFADIIKNHSESEYYTVLEIVGRTQSYADMCEKKLDSSEVNLFTRDDFNYAALIQLNKGCPTEALNTLEESVKAHPFDAKSHYIRALIFTKMNQDDSALQSLQSSIKEDNHFKTLAYNEPDFERFVDNPTFQSLTA